MSGAAIFLVIVAGIGVIALIVVSARANAARERRRIAGVWAWAQSSGFEFYEKDPFDLDTRFKGLGVIGRGHSQYAFEVLRRPSPVPTFLFRYHFATTETRTVTTTDSNGNSQTRTETYEEDHWHAYLIVETGAQFPSLMIRPEHWGDKVAGFIGFEDIDFESEQFSSRYFIKSGNREFAYAVVHPQMMEWLLTQEFTAQLERGCFVAEMNASANDAASRYEALVKAAGFINRIPPFVWQDYGKRERIELPLPRPPAVMDPAEPIPPR